VIACLYSVIDRLVGELKKICPVQGVVGSNIIEHSRRRART